MPLAEPRPPRSRPAISTVIAAAALFTGITLVAAACASPASTATTPTEGGTVVYATGDAEPHCLDPHVGGNYPQALVSTQYLESLVSKNTEGAIIPWLASEWVESADGLSWDLTLRGDVSFTDGTPLNAEAVKANIDHILDPETASSTGWLALRKVAATEVVDEHTIRFSLSTPDSSLLDTLSQPWLAIQSAAAIDRGKDTNCESPVGTGPFIVEKWTKQESITLVRNDDYNSPPADAIHTGPALLDGITWKFIPDSASRFAALQAGTVDVIDNPQPADIAAGTAAGNITDLNDPRPGASNRIELNSSKAPFDDIRVREAFIRSADINDGLAGLFFGTAERSYSALSSIETFGVSAKEPFAIDIDKANALLDEAGWATRDTDGYRVKDGERLTLDFPVSTNQSVPAEQSLFEQIQAQVKEVGFEVLLHPLDLPGWHSALHEEQYDLVSAPYTKVGPDVLRILFHSDSITPAPSGYVSNHSQVNDPAVDALLTEASEVSDPTKRGELYAEVQQKVLADFYLLPLYDQQNHYLLGSAVNDLRTIPTVSTPTFYDVWLSR